MKSREYWANFVANLRADGLIIDDDPGSENSLGKARHYLPHIGAYRFRGYYESFKTGLGHGRTGLNDVLKLCKFDRQLRLLSLDALERIEVSIKAHLTDLMFESFGPQWISHADFRSMFESAAVAGTVRAFLMRAVQQRMEMESTSDRDQTGERVDPTLILEAASFGEISKLVGSMKERPKQQIASHFGIQANVLNDWLRGLTRVRNIAAHHSRLWNARFASRPAFPNTFTRRFSGPILGRSTASSGQARYYDYAIVMYYLLGRIARNTTWHRRLKATMEHGDLLPSMIDVWETMGFPPDWTSQPFWNFSDDA